MDNQPLVRTELRFTPVNGNDLPSSVGLTDDDGYYTLHLLGVGQIEGAVVGEHRVSFSQDPRKGQGIEKGAKIEAARRMLQMRRNQPELLPAKYNRESKITFDVPPQGTCDANFDLKSR
jgi:hypothetical protein